MNELGLVAVFAVCVTVLVHHALKLDHQRRLRAALVAERQADDENATKLAGLLTRAEAAADKSETAAARTEQAKADFDGVVAGLNENFASIETNYRAVGTRIESLEMGMGWRNPSA